MLPTIKIEGLTLKDSLGKLMAAYDEACFKSGETPLPLNFKIPPGADRFLRVHLPAGDFHNSVHMLASLAGMKASRQDLEYRFEPLPDRLKQVKLELEASPGFSQALKDMAAENAGNAEQRHLPRHPAYQRITQDRLAALGLDLDPSTQVSLADSGKLTLETTSTADADAVAALVKSILQVSQAQLKFTTKVVEMPSGSEEFLPSLNDLADVSDLDEDQVQQLMRQLAQKRGVDLMTAPTIVAGNGRGEMVKITPDPLSPADDNTDPFEKHDIGVVLKVKGSRLAFGQELDFNFTNTTGELDSATGQAFINKRTNLANNGFSQNGRTRFMRQTRADGSQTLLFVTSQVIDATGRPIR